MARLDVVRDEQSRHCTSGLIAAALLASVVTTLVTGRTQSVHHVVVLAGNSVAARFASSPPSPPRPPSPPPPSPPPLDPSQLCFVQLSNSEQGKDGFSDLSQMWWYQYAQRHGYSYFRIVDTVPHTDEDPFGRAHSACFYTWHKIVALKHLLPLLPQCELLTVIDSDTKVANQSIPVLDALVRDFNFTGPSMIAMSSEPDAPHNYVHSPIENKAVLNQNTGFVAVRNRPRAAEIIMQWLSCSRRDSSQSCEECLHGWPCEQCAWAKYIRPTLLPSEYTVLPCTHFNSWPGAGAHLVGPNCDARGGLVVQHYWTAKNVAAEHFEQELDKDPLVRQQLLAQVSEEKGTLIKMGPEDTKRVFGLA